MAEDHTAAQFVEIEIKGNVVPLWFFQAPAGFSARKDLGDTITDTFANAFGMESCAMFISGCRGVEAHRLPTIMSNGCDVEPTTAPFFANELWKALEYGCEGDQVIQVFKHGSLKRSWREVSSSMDPAELEELKKTYPTVIESVDGSRLWLTRFPVEDRRAATDYERAHGHWIPGEASEALEAIIFITADLQSFIDRLTSGLSKHLQK